MTDELFSRTFLPLQESLYRVAYHLLRSEQAAEDAVQELYLKLWRGRESLGIVNNPKAYCIWLRRKFGGKRQNPSKNLVENGKMKK